MKYLCNSTFTVPTSVQPASSCLSDLRSISSMLSKKQQCSPPPTSPWTEKEQEKEKEKEKYPKNKELHFKFVTSSCFKSITAFLLVLLSTWFLLVLFRFPPTNTQHQQPAAAQEIININNHEKPVSRFPTCDGSESVYVYNLPPEFNLGLLDDCAHLNVYTNMCPYVANNGLGQPLTANDVVPAGNTVSMPSWYSTHQFIAEMIFHARVKNHPCRTSDPSRASLFYVPFYGGLHASSKFREANYTARDALAVRLGEYLQRQPAWKNHHGKDHFMVLGRTAWDFMRSDRVPDFGANCLLNLPAVQNMSVLTVERQPWRGFNQYGIPYPSYFHPSTAAEMMTWQGMMRRSNRPHLFSFVGAPRKGLEKAAIRDELIRQCSESNRCNLLKCNGGNPKCYDPREVLRVMMESEFCLQAPGDSFTRRSTFDSILAGCIPVFFSEHTAYTQYGWFLPQERREYSVYIDQKGEGRRRIEEELLRIPKEEVERMRSRVIDMIPRLTYAHPNASMAFEDVVDVTLAALAKRVKSNML